MHALIIGLLVLLALLAIMDRGLRYAYRPPRHVEKRDPGDLGLPCTVVRITGRHGKRLFG